MLFFVLGGTHGLASWACPFPPPGRQHLHVPQKLRYSSAHSCLPMARWLESVSLPPGALVRVLAEAPPRTHLSRIQLQQNGSKPCVAFPVAFP